MKALERAAEIRAQQLIANRTYTELSKLSDRELDDIGIQRGELYSISQNVKKD